MAYRKTEKIVAGMEARRDLIVAAAIDVVTKYGLENMTTDAVADRGKHSVGLIYTYFPDKAELLSAVVAHLLNRDVTLIRSGAVKNPVTSLENGISLFVDHCALKYRLITEMSKHPGYREGVRREFQRLIKAATPDVEGPAVLAAAVTGAIFATSGTITPKDERVLKACLLRMLLRPAVRRKTERA